ncbi:hypothetical protein N7474_001068 [Penicillium riverlandense]|uniref:uncharacterized protein n=1 Tax=Penicillium riverlandense TaxID=1903569 RepID=UPI0025499B89|nr:uncharacterized protein N7474_001068 [Penicillium riverlandense]KAJ5832757.1 hypothetical protein N7474_001068 [Penicillium riverlandense]
MNERPTLGLQSPATPIYILRGHTAPIHALHIFNHNLRLISGDADGWIVVWDLVTKRAVTVWKAHSGAVLEVKGFTLGGNVSEIYTHGRDHKLCVWKIRAEDESFLDKTLPVDRADSSESGETQRQPWLLHSLPVNALNFCAFDMTFLHTDCSPEEKSGSDNRCATLFAVPNALDSGGVDIFHLPSERRLSTIRSDPSTKTGMVMAVHLFVSPSGDLYLASAYEDGHVMSFLHRGPLKSTINLEGNASSDAWKWEKIYACRPHTQPVLSIDGSPSQDYFLSSSADALIVKHPVLRSESGGYIPTPRYVEDSPLKIVNTKHSGQQGLRIRSDGMVFATAGWDSRVRVYSGKTIKELAVLKWHKDGCYAVAFGKTDNITESSTHGAPGKDAEDTGTGSEYAEMAGEKPERSLATVQNQRNMKVQQTHWLAAGSKDGKISLWDIY